MVTAPQWTLDDHLRTEKARKRAGLVDGIHYSGYVAEIRAARKAGELDAAAGLLLRMIAAIQREAKHPIAGCAGVPRWYFRELATIYRKLGKEREAGLVMQRYAILQAEAETSGLLLLTSMREASSRGASE